MKTHDEIIKEKVESFYQHMLKSTPVLNSFERASLKLHVEQTLTDIHTQAVKDTEERVMKLINEMTVMASHDEPCDGYCEDNGCSLPTQLSNNRLLLRIEKTLTKED